MIKLDAITKEKKNYLGVKYYGRINVFARLYLSYSRPVYRIHRCWCSGVFCNWIYIRTLTIRLIKMNLSKNQAQLIINNFGISRTRNEIALTINCADNNQTPFEIIQFNSGAAYLSQHKNKTEPYQAIDIRI